MKSKYLIFLLICILSSTILFPQQNEYPLVSVPQTYDKGIPKDWILGGSSPHE